MYMSDGKPDFEPAPLTATGLAGLSFAALVVFYLGVLPTRVIDIAARSIETIF
jgi:NADH:ubiquinone oxidoreductase subunit 2 (subunit N)